MIRSMTAFGRSRMTVSGKDITVEIKSVNSRFLDCSVKIPRLYSFLEEKVKTHVQSRGITRGKVEISISIDVLEQTGTEILLDEAYAASYIDALKRLRDTFALKDDITVMSVAANRDIFTTKKPDDDLERDWSALKPVLDEALDGFIAMRESEGRRLEADMREKLVTVKSLMEQVAAKSSDEVNAYSDRLTQRIRHMLDDNGIEVDDQRILTEVAIFADKTAIDEELVRLDSHIHAFLEILEGTEPAGRKLDFLLQEMNRESNTIGSKANNTEIARHVVALKCELEKLREQIQNIE